jgi:hypothetical protein
MLDTLKFTNRDGSTFFQINDVTSPLTLFDVDVDRVVDVSRKKMQRPGVNPTLPFKGGMEIHCEGSLFDDDSASYVTQRKALLAAINGAPGPTSYSLTDRKDGTLQFRPAGETEDWITDVFVTAFTAPVRALYPALTEYAITMFSANPYFVGVTTGDFYDWS